MAQKNFFDDIVDSLKCFFASIGRKLCENDKKDDTVSRGGGQPDTKKTLARVWDAFTWLVVAAAVVLAVLLAGVRVFGLTPYCVLSGSMEPQYKTGSLIYVKHAAPEDVSVGDAITFVLNEDLVVATHQVYQIDRENRCFYTQGIANVDSEGNIQHDPAPVLYENLIGKPVFTIPKLGYVSDYLSTPPGMYVGIGAALIMLILFFLPDMLKAAEESDAKEAAGRSGRAPQGRDRKPERRDEFFGDGFRDEDE